MLSSKQRAYLRSQANALDSQFQVGKGDIDAQVTQSLDEFMTTHELVKVTVLKTADATPAELAAQLAKSVGAEVVQVIGRRVVLYRYSTKLAKAGKSIEIPF